MGRKKGSLNKKNKPLQLDFENKLSLDEKTEVCMTLETNENNQVEAETKFEDKDHIEELQEEINALMTVQTEEMKASENELEQIRQELDEARSQLLETRKQVEEKKKELLILPESCRKTTNDAPAVSVKDASLQSKIEQMKARDSVMVTGKFHNLRVKGQSVKLPYIKYGDEPVKWHPFSHGQVYTIPKGFADQINGGTESDPCYYMPHFVKNEGAIIDPDDPGTGIHSVDTTDKKYSFTPIHFYDESRQIAM